MAQVSAQARASGPSAGLTRRRFLATTGGVVGAAVLGPTALARAGGRLRAGTYFPWTEVGKGIHATIDLATGGNVMVVAGSESSLMVDTKFPAYAAALKREAEVFCPPITQIVNTHHHADHTGGNAVLRGRIEVLMAHEKAAERIKGQLDRYVGAAAGGPGQVDMTREGAAEVQTEAQSAAETAPAWTAQSAAPNVLMGDGPERIAADDVAIELHYFGPAHTDNDVVVHAVEANVLHSGDLCFNGLHPFFDQTGGVTCRGWSEVLGRVLELCDEETVVVPGHGELTDREGLERQRRYLDQLWDRVSEEVRKRTAKPDVEAMSWGFMDGLGFAQVRSRAIGAVYDEVVAADG